MSLEIASDTIKGQYDHSKGWLKVRLGSSPSLCTVRVIEITQEV